FHLRFTSGLIPVFVSFQDLSLYLKTTAYLTPLYLFLMNSMGNYQERHGNINQYEAQNLFRSITFFYLVSFALTFLFHNQEHSRITIVLSFFMNVILSLTFHSMISKWQISAWRKNKNRIRLLLLGHQPDLLEDVALEIQNNPDLGFELHT